MRHKALVPLMIAMVLMTGACKSGKTNADAAPAPVSSSTPAVVTPTGAATTDPGATPATTGADPAACPTSNTKTFAKTKLVLHAGLAFGAFHRYLYKPYKAGSFTTGSKVHRVVVIAKAGGSALFIKREIRLSIEDVKANPTLCRAIAAPLSHLSSTVSDGISKLKGGDTSGLEAANTEVASIQAMAKGGGLALPDAANPPSN